MRASMRMVISGEWPARAKVLSTSPTRIGSRIGQVEAMAVQPGLVRDVVHRVDDVIHRHDVDAPAFDAERRHPRRQHLAQLLEEGEEVVRAVDLVHLAGLRMAHHHARAVDAPLDALLLPHQPFGIVLGAQVRIVQAFGLVEHVLAEHARVQARGGDRTGVVEARRRLIAAARSSALRVPSMLATRCGSALAVRS